MAASRVQSQVQTLVVSHHNSIIGIVGRRLLAAFAAHVMDDFFKTITGGGGGGRIIIHTADTAKDKEGEEERPRTVVKGLNFEDGLCNLN